jgi:AraC-like DNA-binding protein
MAAGLDVTETAMELGYQTPSALSDAFRRTFGTPPSRF